ncbi:helix-turn-helix domain-containing protein [Streptomyces sp. NPDC048606]|uniref:GlxA family transcriptional regulator n=1 Tax=Streptomyces sp. NPDC048606 TaxID=3154726 RepID=UPI00344265C2
MSGGHRSFAHRQARYTSLAYRITTASPGGSPVRSLRGLRLVPDMPLEKATAPHTLIVPGGGIERYRASATDSTVAAWLARHGDQARRITSVCTGASSLIVDPDPVFVRDGLVITAAGVTSGIDMSLALVEEDISLDAATTIVRYMVVHLRRQGSQPQLSTHLKAQLAHRPAIRRVQQWLAAHPEADRSIDSLAARANLSPRQFARAFVKQTGTSPGRYAAAIRLETARRLLDDTDHDLSRIARQAGYTSTEGMRRAFRQALATSPSRYRSRRPDS